MLKPFLPRKTDKRDEGRGDNIKQEIFCRELGRNIEIRSNNRYQSINAQNAEIENDKHPKGLPGKNRFHDVSFYG